MKISQPLAELEWIPRPRLLALRRLGIETGEDLLTHFPRRHEDRQQFAQFPREESEQPICLCGEVIKTSVRRFGGWKKIFEATLQEPNANALSQPLVCRWFNLHYVQKMIATGHRLVVFGKPRKRGNRICMEHPEFEVIENDPAEAGIHFRRITPIYPATEGLSQRVLRSMIYRVLQDLNSDPVATLVPRQSSFRDDSRADQGDWRNSPRPCGQTPDESTASGRCRFREDRCRHRRDSARGRGWLPGSVYGPDADFSGTTLRRPAAVARTPWGQNFDPNCRPPGRKFSYARRRG